MARQLDLFPDPPGDLLAAIEETALELARLGGAEIEAGLSRTLTIDYKSEGKDGRAPRDPVSELDRSIEEAVRSRIAERFPSHGVIGEEIDVPAEANEYLWVIDPVDGTSNFLNGFPFVACSIGVLHHGRPVAGAIWCSSGPLLRPGVYHARRGGPLAFEGIAFDRVAREGLRRRLAAAPGGASASMPGWDHRVTGSAAMECALVAAGAFNSAAFFAPGIWDVAAGVVLVQAAGLEVRERTPRSKEAWLPFERFRAPDRPKDGRPPSVRDWRRSLLMGEASPVEQRIEALRARSGFRLPWFGRR